MQQPHGRGSPSGSVSGASCEVEIFLSHTFDLVFWLPGPTPQNNAREFSMVSRSASPKFRAFYTTNSMAVEQVGAYTAYNGSKDPLHHDFK